MPRVRTGPAISVLTCAARGQYLAQTIASIDRGGGREFKGPKTIHVDGPLDASHRFKGWSMASVSRECGGARRAMLAIMSRAAAARVSTLLYFEDDVLICKNAIRAMIEIGVPRPLGFVAYCDLSWHGRTMELTAVPGCPRTRPVPDGVGFVGCQALALPLRTLQALATTPAPRWLGRNDCDGTIGTCCDVYGVLDSLATHTGLDSCITGGNYGALFRRVRGWPGEDFDADTVPRRFALERQLGQLGERCPLHGGVLHAHRRRCQASSPQHEALEADPAVD
jgi:hypothetical protein